MTHAQIDARIAQLRRAIAAMHEERRKLDLDVAATDGAIQDCEYWLAQMTADTFPVGQQDETDDVVLGTARTDGS